MIRLQRIRPTRTALAVLVGLLWALSFGAARDFVWADLRTGLIDLRGLSRVTRGLVWLGFVLLFAMVGALLFNDLWRALSPLMAGLNATPGRGEFVPVALVPATLFLFALAWGFVLTGALRSHPAIRVAVLALFLFVAAGWVNSNTAIALGAAGYDVRAEMAFLAIHWGVVALVPIFFVLRWRAAPRPGLEFLVLMLLVSAMLALAQAREVNAERILGMSTMLPLLETNIVTLQGLVVPLLLLIGIDIAGFTWQAADWVRRTIAERLPQGAAYLPLAALLGWRLRDVVDQALARVANSSFDAELLAYAGALGLPLTAGLVWWVITRLPGPDGAGSPGIEDVAESAERWGLPTILIFSALQLVADVIGIVGLSIPGASGLRGLQARILAAMGVLNDTFTTPWHLLVNAAAVAGSLWLARRGRHAPALYLGIFGAMHLWYEVSNPGRPLAFLSWRGPEPEDFWWVMLCALAALFWLLRGTLTVVRAERLLFLVLITALLRQTDFIENPFSPFFGFAGIGFIAFGIVWDSLTVGSWANESTPGLPRIGRIFLYVGYVLLTVTVINWALASHDLTTVGRFTGDTALVGLTRFGKPMLYAMFFIALALPGEARATPGGDGGGDAPHERSGAKGSAQRAGA